MVRHVIIVAINVGERIGGTGIIPDLNAVAKYETYRNHCLVCDLSKCSLVLWW
jgi:hypothetical protein